MSNAVNCVLFSPHFYCQTTSHQYAGPINTVFSFNVMPDNRMATCAPMNQESGLFFCEFCYGRDTCEEPTMCLNVTISTATQIPNITDGRYCYRATAVHNEAPIALIQDYFTGKHNEQIICILPHG